MNKQLSNWFDGIIVTRKREDISLLLKKLVRKHNPSSLPLPDIQLPTLNGEVLEAEDTYNETDETADFEEEEIEEEEVKRNLSCRFFHMTLKFVTFSVRRWCFITRKKIDKQGKDKWYENYFKTADS